MNFAFYKARQFAYPIGTLQSTSIKFDFDIYSCLALCTRTGKLQYTATRTRKSGIPRSRATSDSYLNTNYGTRIAWIVVGSHQRLEPTGAATQRVQRG